MEEKEILLKVPQGKKAVWNEDGCLQLVDEEQPKDITERIKTFNDACLMTEGKTEKEKSKEYRLMMIVSEICKMVEDGRKGRHAQRENFEKAIDFKKRIGSYTVDDYIRAYKAFVADTMENDMANVCIRIFDMAGEFNLRLDLTEAVGDYNDFSKDFAFRGYNLLTYIVDWDIIDDEEYLSWHLSELIAALFQWAEHDGIDLNWHIERKMVKHKEAPAKGARDNNPKSHE